MNQGEVNMAKIKIYVTLREGILDVQGKMIHRALGSLGYDNVEDVKMGKYIQVELEDNKDLDQEIKKMCEQLLTNPVIEDYTYEVE